MKKYERKRRLALTLLFSFVVFCILLLAVALSGITVYLLIHNDVLAAGGAGRSGVWYPILFMAGISSVLGFALSAVLGKLPLRPINRLISQMNRLASGDFKARLHYGRPISAHPVFYEISESFNKMAEELENTEMLRSDFINNFSHEFKTPIVSIAGFAKLLRRGNLNDAQRAEYAEIIEAESIRLAYMATNVLNLTKVENQTILTDTAEYNLSEQIRSCILLLEPKWTKKQIDLRPDFAEHTIRANAELLKQVWINLIDNAIKFSPIGGRVELTVSEENSELVVSVINTGSEIAMENQEKIFNKFYQADESHAAEGNGVGLAIVKRIVELHGGAVTVHCSGGLTVFSVTLPKAASDDTRQ